jgi:CRP-like cAMP-binding protein
MPKLDETLLTGLPAFSKLQRAEIRQILDLATAQRYDEGTAIFNEGGNADRFYFLLDGHVRAVKTTPGGDQIIVLHIGPGQLFGIAPALQRDTYPATAMAAAETLTLSWPVHLWSDFTSKYDGFATETYRTVGKRLGEVQDALAEVATKAVEQRIACVVLRMVTQSGRKTKEGIEIGFPVTRQNISDMAGTTLHTVSRLLSGWEKDGVVMSTRKHIVVTNPHQLMLLTGANG